MGREAWDVDYQYQRIFGSVPLSSDLLFQPSRTHEPNCSCRNPSFRSLRTQARCCSPLQLQRWVCHPTRLRSPSPAPKRSCLEEVCRRQYVIRFSDNVPRKGKAKGEVDRCRLTEEDSPRDPSSPASFSTGTHPDQATTTIPWPRLRSLR